VHALTAGVCPTCRTQRFVELTDYATAPRLYARIVIWTCGLLVLVFLCSCLGHWVFTKKACTTCRTQRYVTLTDLQIFFGGSLYLWLKVNTVLWERMGNTVCTRYVYFPMKATFWKCRLPQKKSCLPGSAFRSKYLKELYNLDLSLGLGWFKGSMVLHTNWHREFDFCWCFYVNVSVAGCLLKKVKNKRARLAAPKGMWR
jgi:hypothetical protein